MTEARKVPNSSGIIRTVRGTWTLWLVALAFAAGIFVTTFTLTSGAYGVEIAVLLAAGMAGGALVRALARENLVAAIFALIIAAECVVLSQSALPWSTLWPVLIPGNAIGVMVGAIVRETLRESRPRFVREARKHLRSEDEGKPSEMPTAIRATATWKTRRWLRSATAAFTMTPASPTDARNTAST